MTEIKNLLFQPLTFHLADGRGLHLGPRERRPIADDQISPEIELAEKRRFVQIDRAPTAAVLAAPETATARVAAHPQPSTLDATVPGTEVDESGVSTRRKRR